MNNSNNTESSQKKTIQNKSKKNEKPLPKFSWLRRFSNMTVSGSQINKRYTNTEVSYGTPLVQRHHCSDL